MRLEYKYLVPGERLPELRAMVAPFVEADVYTAQRGLAGYTVRSIYFDTSTLAFHQEKVAGLKVRRKLRLRGYNEYRQGDLVFLETKGKYGRMVVKGRAPVRYEQVPVLLASGEVERYILTGPTFPNALEDARQFFFHLRRGAGKPLTCRSSRGTVNSAGSSTSALSGTAMPLNSLSTSTSRTGRAEGPSFGSWGGSPASIRSISFTTKNRSSHRSPTSLKGCPYDHSQHSPPRSSPTGQPPVGPFWSGPPTFHRCFLLPTLPHPGGG